MSTCELYDKISLLEWIYFIGAFIPLAGLFTFIYKRFGIPIKKGGVIFSIVSSAMTYAGLVAMAARMAEITSLYDFCDIELTGTPDFAADSTREAALASYIIATSISFGLYIVFFIFGLKSKLDKYVSEAVKAGKCAKAKGILVKILLFVIKFGLGAIYVPFYVVGVQTPLGETKEEQCLCVDDYAWTIANLYWFVVGSVIAFFTYAITIRYTGEPSLGGIKDEGPCPIWTAIAKKQASYAITLTPLTLLSAAIVAFATIYYVRAVALVIEISESGVLRVEVLVFLILLAHAVALIVFRKYLTGEKDCPCKCCNKLHKCLCCCCSSDDDDEVKELEIVQSASAKPKPKVDATTAKSVSPPDSPVPKSPTTPSA